MKNIWKVLAAAAAITALVPYRVDKDGETGETQVTALLWKATHSPKTEEHDQEVIVDVGLNLPITAEAEIEADEAEIDESEMYDDDVVLATESFVTEAAAEETTAPEIDPA